MSSRRWVEPDFPVLESKLAMQHARFTLRKIFTATLAREGKDAPLMAWPLACGGKTAERTSAIAFADGVLTVAVPDKAWRQQLQSFSRQQNLRQQSIPLSAFLQSNRTVLARTAGTSMALEIRIESETLSTWPDERQLLASNHFSPRSRWVWGPVSGSAWSTDSCVNRVGA